MRAGRVLFLLGGLVAVGVGIVGVITPGLPGTVFLIVALFCFKRSSPRMEAWLLNHPRFGPTLLDWEQHRSIKPRTKIVAITVMWVFIGSTFFRPLNPWFEALLVALGAYGTWFIATRPSVGSGTALAPR